MVAVFLFIIFVFGKLNADICSPLTTCFSCLLQSGCGYCFGSTSGDFGCYLGNSQGPTNTSICQGRNDIFAYSPDMCPDPCSPSQYNGACDRCVIETTLHCGWCMGGSGCRSGSPSGPWSPQIPCSSWRWQYPQDNRTVSQICTPYSNCSSSIFCAGCLDTRESAYQGCSWCSADNGTLGECFPSDGNLTCPPDLPYEFDIMSQCPEQQMNDAMATQFCSESQILLVQFLFVVLFFILT